MHASDVMLSGLGAQRTMGGTRATGQQREAATVAVDNCVISGWRAFSSVSLCKYRFT
jgi:hypothetical protein